MSVTMTRADGVTAFTLTYDTNSACPPLCQILRGLCYSPVLCSVSQSLRTLQSTSQSVLGALQIMTGVFNIGLGSILIGSVVGSWYEMDFTGFPFWLGTLFILFGTTTILSEKFPSPCLVIVSVILNLCGVAFAITAIVLYSINLANAGYWWMCEGNDYWYDRQTSTPSPDKAAVQKICMEATHVSMIFVRSISIVLIVLAVLELCLVISSATLGIKALCRRQSAGDKSTQQSELYKPLLEEAIPQFTV